MRKDSGYCSLVQNLRIVIFMKVLLEEPPEVFSRNIFITCVLSILEAVDYYSSPKKMGVIGQAHSS